MPGDTKFYRVTTTLEPCALCGEATARALIPAFPTADPERSRPSGRCVPLCNPCFRGLRAMPSGHLDQGVL